MIGNEFRQETKEMGRQCRCMYGSKKETFVGSLSLRTLVGMAQRGDFCVYFYVVRAGNVD